MEREDLEDGVLREGVGDSRHGVGDEEAVEDGELAGLLGNLIGIVSLLLILLDESLPGTLREDSVRDGGQD